MRQVREPPSRQLSDSVPKPWWCRLGRLLPRDVRERVYEPACYERLRRGLEGRGRRATWIPLYALAAFVAIAGFNLPWVFFDGRRLSGLGKATLVAGVVVSTLVYAAAMVRYSYAAG